jgi:tetratricopeptide (TPR) repeat protein
MTDDIGHLTGQLAQDPSSLVFMSLAEALRRKGQLDAALTVAQRGLARYPEVADAHDLVARIHADRGEGDAAFDAWTDALRVAPDHPGAHKGLAFLAFRGGDLARSLRHLGRALELAPGDATLAAAADRIRAVAATRTATAIPRDPSPASSLQPRGPIPAPGPAGGPPPRVSDQATLLFDQQGRVLRGSVTRPDGSDASDAVAAALAGVSREAERAIRLLGLGEWHAVAVEGGPVNYEIRSPTSETLLFVMRGREVPAGRLSRIAGRAVEEARHWLEAPE